MAKLPAWYKKLFSFFPPRFPHPLSSIDSTCLRCLNSGYDCVLMKKDV